MEGILKQVAILNELIARLDRVIELDRQALTAQKGN